ncbi:unnamed protein product (macronuclear) [Paramecium tetraurelia]|uniref:Serine aminopeptidase S33 domain-containing protein n=1 Tax=Paramecium tetraurelia TaxID=5888 RepID=A0DHP0_PARTE|nr:uncharacterized protein GSPATT00016944001 [Paramecium tetraurelia]CAK82557.1 unnamed protein product [Paramecium tetraurelia]|eukprot:XP_001449954.1 hypothetical protein (macronuclear) [Paramecium tetraurelia strain d4-2]
MQQQNDNVEGYDQLQEIAKTIFPGWNSKYYRDFAKQVQFVEFEGANRIPYYFLENEDKSTNNYIIYFHGNGENIENSLNMLQRFTDYLKTHFILVEYPGYGNYQSTIVTTAEQIEKDALVVFDYIKQKFAVNDNQIYVFGRSIGTGPAFYLGANRNCAGLIILSAYITLYKLVNDIVPKRAHYLLNENHINNEENSQKIKCKCLFIHGQKDNLTFLKPIQDLYNNLPAHIKEQSYLSIQENMSHNNFLIKEHIIDPILNFYTELKITKDEQNKEKDQTLQND